APLYEAVTDALKRIGMTKVQLHQRSGVARSTIDGWKTRMTPPHAATVLNVARVVGIEDDEALRLAVLKGPKAIPPADLAEVPTDVVLAEIRRRIPDWLRSTALGVYRGLGGIRSVPAPSGRARSGSERVRTAVR